MTGSSKKRNSKLSKTSSTCENSKNEEERKVEMDWHDPKELPDDFSIGGYVPGDYIGKCRECEKTFIGIAKYSVFCLPCAIVNLQKGAAYWEKKSREFERKFIALKEAIEIIKED